MNYYETPEKEVVNKYQDKYLFGGNAIKVLVRDRFMCVNCGMKNEEHKARWGRRLAVDHIDHKGTTVPKKERNNSLDNLQTLCFPCHGKKDTKNIYKRVSQFDLEGNFIKEFESISGAARYFKQSKSNLTHHLSGKKHHSTFAGYTWRVSK